MIKVEFELNSDDSISGFVLKGHANFAAYGEDIVCSAVSAISQTAVIGLQRYFEGKLYISKTKGLLSCGLSKELDSEERIIADAVLNTMYWGLKEIESEYGTYLKVILRRCTE